jgi:hypothetical protein
LLHHGVIVVGLPYAEEPRLSEMTQVSGGTC